MLMKAIRNINKIRNIQKRTNNLLTLKNLMPCKRAAFTMAEILLSLTIIGVVAAITLPALTGNINEKMWTTQRKALHVRISQAIALMGSLNGYGIGATESETASKAAETFVTNGLAKVLKINNICAIGHFYDCGINYYYKNMMGAKLAIPQNLHRLNETFSLITNNYNGTSYSTSNTDAIAFETQNGESIVAYYNPFCIADDNSSVFSQAIMCVNFIYDLNREKGPNTIGKDMGVITVFKSVDSITVAPIPSSTQLAINDVQFYMTSNACTAKDSNSRLPNIYELSSLSINRIPFATPTANELWSNSHLGAYIWAMYAPTGVRKLYSKNNGADVYCIKR